MRNTSSVEVDDGPAGWHFVPAADAIAAFTATALPEPDVDQWWHDIREGGDAMSGPDTPEDPWEREARR